MHNGKNPLWENRGNTARSARQTAALRPGLCTLLFALFPVKWYNSRRAAIIMGIKRLLRLPHQVAAQSGAAYTMALWTAIADDFDDTDNDSDG